MKCEATQELVVGGFTDPQGARVGLGALLVGYFEGDDFVFAGKIGTGFDTKLLLELRARLDALEIPTAAVHEGARACRACARTGSARRSSSRSASSSGPCTASCATRGCSASLDKPARGRERDHASREGAVPRRRHHQGRARGLLRGDRAGDAAAHPRPAGDDGALSRRHRQEGLLAEGRLEGLSRRGSSASKCRRRTAPSTIRSSPTLRSLLWIANQNTITPHVWTSRAPDSDAPRRLRVRSRSVAGRAGAAARRGGRGCATCSTSSGCPAGSRPPARRASTSSCRSTARRDDGRGRADSRTRVGAAARRSAIRSS